jgi:hypothetical protein
LLDIRHIRENPACAGFLAGVVIQIFSPKAPGQGRAR